VQPSVQVRAIEWESVSGERVGALGLSPVALKEFFGDQPELALVRCVCVGRRGEKFTCLADAQHFKGLIDSGQAGDPAGMTLEQGTWPVVLRGWVRAS
jgi:hypothetical protein